MTIKPDFLIIPMVVYDHEDLCPTDKIIYSIVYWYEHMKDGKCIASNQSIADIAKVEERTVRVGLERLEAAGFIRREFKDAERKVRLQIRCLVQYAVRGDRKTVQKKSSLPAVQDEPMETPKEFAQKFFDGDRDSVGNIGMVIEKWGIPQQVAVREMIKFRDHWTEPSPSGRRQKWQMQQTFDVKRRLQTWFRNAAEWQDRDRNKKGSGAGVTV